MEIPSQLLLVSLMILVAGVISSSAIHTMYVKQSASITITLDTMANQIISCIIQSVRKAYAASLMSRGDVVVEQIIILNNKDCFVDVIEDDQGRYLLKVYTFQQGVMDKGEISILYPLPIELNKVMISYAKIKGIKCVNLVILTKFSYSSQKAYVDIIPT